MQDALYMSANLSIVYLLTRSWKPQKMSQNGRQMAIVDDKNDETGIHTDLSRRRSDTSLIVSTGMDVRE